MARQIDFHMHSTALDGTDTPVELVGKIADACIQTFALTDHDTVDGVEEVMGLVS